MARRRKAELQLPAKEKPQSPIVRKSTRQRAKKELEEQKVNGDSTPSNANNSEDCKDSQDDSSQESIKKIHSAPKKSTRYKNQVVNEKSNKVDKSENNSQENEQSEELNDLRVRESPCVFEENQPTADSNVLDQVMQDWSEEIVEETVICEEMEIETEVVHDCPVVQHGNVTVGQVLCNNFEGQNVVDYTIIHSEDGAEPAVVPLANEEMMIANDSCASSNSYEAVEKGLSVLQVSDLESANPSSERKKDAVLENHISGAALCDSVNSDNLEVNANSSNKESRKLRSVSRSSRSSRTSKVIESVDKQAKKESDNRRKRTETLTKKVAPEESKISDQACKEKIIAKDVMGNKSESVIEQNDQNPQKTVPRRDEPIFQGDNSSSILDKMDIQETSNAPSMHPLMKDKIVNNSVILDQRCVSRVDTEQDLFSRLPAKVRTVIFGEEHSQDSELEIKTVSADVKVSSSSENSSDTLLSSSTCKVSDSNTDIKSTINQTSEIDKKSEITNQSESTDTTSESGSNSSGVRRSSRIKSIGLKKPRSRGRGLVTKPSMDIAKSVIQPERNQTPNALPVLDNDSTQIRDRSNNILEKILEEQNSNKTLPAPDIVSSVTTATGTAGFDSDSNKPVKVKSRWRRSSELEMSNFGSWTASQPNLGFSNPAAIGSSVGNIADLLNAPLTKSPPLPVGILQEPGLTSAQDSVVTGSSQSSSSDSFGTSSVVDTVPNHVSDMISQIVGAKIPLPMVPKVEDREMEERLSQFEHLKENLYLTERYTSKETKRMVCDCFLTEEEIERGELGCGEDCLNRLLMIECGSRCVVGSRCTNKRFQNSEYATCEVFRTEKKGFGLRATIDLWPDDFIMEYVGEVLDSRTFRKRAKEYSKDKNRHYYFMALKSDQIIDATMKGNISRFINHSCDPNAETQKWTVNGELRIGFFSRKFVRAGDEITFDYHFQRYGKEAQKCFCEAENCRGWIGDNPDDSKAPAEAVDEFEESEEESEVEVEDKEEEKTDKEEKPKKRVRRKRVAKKVPDHMEDEDLEEQIEKLLITGLKNRSHTLTLSRLMVRSREMQHRIRLLEIIQSGEQPCRRLFLDYHGLRLIWSYMMDVAGSTSDEAQKFRLEVLRTLATLPIPNRTMLIDSKVLSLVEKWSKHLYHSPSGDSPEDDQLKLKSSSDDVEMDGSEKKDAPSTNEVGEVKKEIESEVKEEIKPEIDPALISELAANLLVSWSNLKEVFRIPKKERIEQMKEHEREADRGYKDDAERDGRDSSSNDKHRSDRYSRSEIDKRSERRRGRDSPDSEYSRSKDKRVLDERPDLVQVPRMSKFERRQLFALKVAKEEEERLRRQQEDSWQQHEAQCLALGLDPYTTAAYDAQTGYPLFFNHQLGQWQAYPIQAEGTPASIGDQQCTPVYMGTPVSGTALPGQVLVMPPDVYPGAPPGYVAGTGLPPPNGTPVYSTTTPPGSAPTLTPTSMTTESDVPANVIPAPPPPLDLPPRWKWTRDKRGRIYYYHVKERVAQWLPPPPDHIAVQPDSSDTSESSGDESSASDPAEEDDTSEQPQDDQHQPGEATCESMEIDGSEASATVTAAANDTISVAVSVPVVPVAAETPKKRRDGLVQERIISPRREEDRVDHKKYKEIKEKLRRQKERAKLKEQLEKMKKHRRGSKSKSHAKHSTSKFQPIVSSDMSPTQERKIKDAFRINMANVMVHFLNPYRKNDCKQGRITNTEDFKHLARKLTHFVLAKELKHCKSVDELECNDNVKHKAKDFVRKYMNKFGPVYQKGTDED
ncbi:hypothetical protein QAD02_016973 [Eretmocerus hayati]|uniref:Uncharacterized protein n=1 Tax=Eretmocerus hayati TaxID=131215 RepID=A0ACC2PCK0_9HYME|nr:hypothetical protein QAD02_016973 [Eretmocerus hayati]